MLCLAHMYGWVLVMEMPVAQWLHGCTYSANVATAKRIGDCGLAVVGRHW